MAGGRQNPSWTRSALALSKTASNLLIAWSVPLVFLHYVDFVAQSIPLQDAARDLDLVDAFAGAAALSTVFRQNGLKAESFDINDGKQGDILDPQGWFRCIHLVLRCKPGAVLFGGPPCGSWVFVNRYTSGRSKTNVTGNQSRAYVKLANQITARWILLGLLAIARGCKFITEQPSSSLMTGWIYVKYLALIIRPIFWGNVKFPMGAYGHRTRKPTVCFGTAEWLPLLARKLTEKDKSRIKALAEDTENAMVIKRVNKQGKVTVQGGPGMKKSAVYPRGFAKAVLKHHLKAKPKKVPTFELTPGIKAPYKWRHAACASMRAVLKKHVADGDYTPLMSRGLFDDL